METFDIDDDILDNHYDHSSYIDNNSDDDDYENEFSMLNPDLLDYDMKIMELMMNQLDLLLLLQFLMLLYLKKFSMTCVHNSVKGSKICLISL